MEKDLQELKKNKRSLKRFLKSFKYCFEGMRYAFYTETGLSTPPADLRSSYAGGGARAYRSDVVSTLQKRI